MGAFLAPQNLFRIAIFLILCGGFLMIYMKLETYMMMSDDYPRTERQERSVPSGGENLVPSDGGTANLFNLDFLHEANSMESFEKKPLVTYNRSQELIWVGGCPRSGTTLSRAMLDAHPDIRCGEETHIIPLLLDFHAKQLINPFMKQRLADAHVTGDVLGDALAAYILTIIWKHGDMALHLCNKDPMVLNHIEMVLNMFPNSKFMMMIRDGRAVCHSMIDREVAIGGFDTKTYRGCLEDWNRLVDRQYKACTWAGTQKCRVQFYEQLVLHPEEEMVEILDYLRIPWNDAVLHHTDTIGQDGGVQLAP